MLSQGWVLSQASQRPAPSITSLCRQRGTDDYHTNTPDIIPTLSMPASLRSHRSVTSLRSRRTFGRSRSLKTFAKRTAIRVKHLRRRPNPRKDVEPPTPTPVPTSSFLELPYELRENIYIYAFASSKIHFTYENRYRGWDCLAMTNRQIRCELNSIPIRLLVAPIEATWARSDALYPIHIKIDIENRERSRLMVLLPRSVLSINSWLLYRVLSAVLTIKTERTTISLYDDGTSLLELFKIEYFFRSIQRFLFVHYTTYEMYLHFDSVNAKEVVFLWPGHVQSISRWGDKESEDLLLDRIMLSKPGSSRVPACYITPRACYITPRACYITPRRSFPGTVRPALEPMGAMQGIAVASETRFRPLRSGKRQRKVEVKTMQPAEFFKRYFGEA